MRARPGFRTTQLSLPAIVTTGFSRRVWPEHAVEPPSGDGQEQIIAQLEAELRDAREQLHTITEELETSNEELRSSNEELPSVNEEVQSSNSELQTSKEELQSINEELQTVDLELNNRVDELSQANNYLKNLLENMQMPMLFLDNNLSVRNFRPSATQLFSLRESDVGRPITDITSRLDYQRLDDDIREVRHTQQGLDREVEAANGHAYIMRVLLYRTTEDVIDDIILTFTDITETAARRGAPEDARRRTQPSRQKHAGDGPGHRPTHDQRRVLNGRLP